LRTGTVELLALDLDGTLVGADLRLTQGVKDAVRRVIEAGVRVAIVTGRMYQAARPFVAELELSGTIICYQGAAVFDAPEGTLVREVPLAHAVAFEVVRKARADGVHVQLYRDDDVYVESLNSYAEVYAAVSGVRPIVVASLGEAFEGHDTTKLVLVAEPDRAAAYAGEIAAFCGDRAYVTRSQPEFVEVLNPHVDKGESLRWVAEREGISLRHAVAVGDSWNDAPLLEAVGFGVAMGSAPRELLVCADAVVADAANDGVVEAIERFVVR